MPTENTAVNYFCNLLSESQIAFLLSAFLMTVDPSQGRGSADLSFILIWLLGWLLLHIQEQKTNKK